MRKTRNPLFFIWFKPPVLVTLAACVLAVFLTVRGCGGGLYGSLDGKWQGAYKGQAITAEFRTHDGVAVFDGKSGVMSLKEASEDTLTLQMTDAQGQQGEALIHRIDEDHIRLEITRAALQVDLERVKQ